MIIKERRGIVFKQLTFKGSVFKEWYKKYDREIQVINENEARIDINTIEDEKQYTIGENHSYYIRITEVETTNSIDELHQWYLDN